MSSSSHRRQNPSRSAAESTARHKNYRLKSYLEANTQERARFESMQDHVPDKIAEVMASFREDKLVVQPHHRRQPVAEIETEAAPPVVRPRARPAVATPVMPRSRPLWPWYAGAMVLAVAAMIWVDVGSDVAAPAADTAEVSVSPPVATPAVNTPAAHTGSIVAAPPATAAAPVVAQKPEKSASGKVVARSESRREVARASDRPAAQGSRTRAAPARDEIHHYSEDLTGLLQGNP